MNDRTRKLIAGNWKMNGFRHSIAELDAIIRALDDAAHAELWVFPPFTLIAEFAARAAASSLLIGAQNVHAEPCGARTGDISAEMLADAGAKAVIVGHSERRADCGETDEAVRAKAEAALRAGLEPVICVGETEAERDAGRAIEAVRRQLAGSLPGGGGFVVAYEPVWAIGTGRTPSRDEIAEMHAAIRAEIGGAARLLYGGSVKPQNAADLLMIPNVDGALVGGASLKAADFLAIARSARADASSRSAAS
ncbi:MAG: triose-phosphate isomerase [Sphingomonadaceae bacterium]|nr:triose-phosphate isomerase [Sphingomonadaceae bacterium]